VKIRNWFKRDVKASFKKYGAGLPTYFELIRYFTFFVFVANLVSSIYHIYMIEFTCSMISDYNRMVSKAEQLPQCFSYFTGMKFVDSESIVTVM
jgi:hypothetical protein